MTSDWTLREGVLDQSESLNRVRLAREKNVLDIKPIETGISKKSKLELGDIVCYIKHITCLNHMMVFMAGLRRNDGVR